MSNTEYLSECLGLLENDTSELNTEFGLEASISAIAISTGFSGGNSTCLKLFEQLILNNEKNKALVFLQNYMNSPNSDFEEKIKDLKVSKLIILDDNETNQSIFEKLNNLRNPAKILPIMLNTYMNGKFHHKTVIQYKDKRKHRPIIYTGSFNISNNAVKNNSENIIGIESYELPGIFLSSLLNHHSSLNNNSDIWRFFQRNSIIVDEGIEDHAARTLVEIKGRYSRYERSFNKAIADLQRIIGYDDYYGDDILSKLIQSFERAKGRDKKSEKLSDLVNFIFHHTFKSQEIAALEETIEHKINLKLKEIIKAVNKSINNCKEIEENLYKKTSNLVEISEDSHSNISKAIDSSEFELFEGPSIWLERIQILLNRTEGNIDYFKTLKKNVHYFETLKKDQTIFNNNIKLLKENAKDIKNIHDVLYRINKIPKKLDVLSDLEGEITSILPEENKSNDESLSDHDESFSD